MRTKRFNLVAGALVGIAAVAAACGGGEPEKILPAPMTSPQAGSAATQPDQNGGGATAGGPTSGACPSYAPDRCGDGAASQCVALQSDAEHCGGCDHACPAQAACSAGVCTPAPEELTTAAGCGEPRLTLHADRLFWNEPKTGRIRSISVSGGAVAELASKQRSPGQVATDGANAYWFTTGDGTSGSSALLAMPLSGVGEPVILKVAPGTDPINGLALAGGKLLYGLVHDVHAISLDAVDGADDVVGVAVARNDTRIPTGIPNALTVHGDRAYWIVTDVGSVECDDLLPGDAGYPRVAHGGEMWPNDLGFAGDFTYFAAADSLYAAQMNVPATAVASTGAATIGPFAVIDMTAYLSDATGRILQHGVELPTGEPLPPVPLARDQGQVTSVVADATHLYWASVAANGDCSIRRLAR
jgi:hypothetical protein